MKKRRAGHRQSNLTASEPTGLLTVLVALLSSAFLWPSEGAINGDGLHLSFLWLVALAGFFLWQRWQMSIDASKFRSDRSARQWTVFLTSAEGMVTIGLAVFLAGTWLSTWQVFHVSGDRRAALNLAFDWTAIGACACLCRMLARHPVCRRTIVNLIAGLGVGLAVYGMWQSQVFYATETKAYLEQRRVLDAGNDPLEVTRIQQDFARREIPLEGPARLQFEARLLNSTEPFGPFALTNTLAGVLAVSLVLFLGGLLADWRNKKRHWKQLTPPLIALGIITWCLILTKSRTAWTGAAIGTAILLLSQNGRRLHSSLSGSRTILRTVLMIGVPAALLFIVGILTGVIDKEVLLESPRSLQFRFFYWIGAAGVIGDEPLFGAGPGNFRQLYLVHKTVESSEAILDPHNFLLDAWCFAGITGFVGILLLVAGIVRSVRASSDETAEITASHSVAPGLLGCLLLHFGWLWLSGWVPSGQDAVTLAAVVLAGFSSSVVSRLTWNSAAPAAAAVALLVHLLGAGGLQITISGFLIVVLATLATTSPTPGRKSQAAVESHRSPLPAMITTAGIAMAILFWGLIPVLGARLQQGIGQLRLRTGDARGALHAFELAAVADSLSPTLRQQIVHAATYSLMRQNRQGISDPASEWSQKDIDTIESLCADSIRSDTRQVGNRLTRARIYNQLYRITHQSRYIEFCLSDLRLVVAGYPTNAAFQVELASQEQLAGQFDQAFESAQKARAIEAVNQGWGHSDQYLSASDLRTIDQIINGKLQ